jgi:hypothetical protein
MRSRVKEIENNTSSSVSFLDPSLPPEGAQGDDPIL